MDLEIAGRIEPTAEPAVASDAVDEFLLNLQKVTNGSKRPSLCGTGERLIFRATDTNAVWTVTLREGGFDLARESDDSDTLVEGPALELLLAVLRRRSVDAGRLDVSGDRELTDFWLANSAFD
jgi:predicted lipid carrier protein YhbT